MIPILNNKYPFYLLSFAVLYLFLALRYDFGNDYLSYLHIHQAINEGRYAWGASDALYKILNLLIPNFNVFVAVNSFFYMVCIFILIKNNLSRNQYWLATLILLINPYLFLIHLSSFRQTLAICFVILAVYFVIKKQTILYFLFVLLASGFHQSALIILPAYFLLTTKKVSFIKGILIIVIVILLLSTSLMNTLILSIINYFPTNYLYYFNQDLQNSMRATLISSFFFFLILFNINRLKGKEMIYGKLALISTIISLLAFKVSMITRVGMYFDIFLIVIIPLIFSKMKQGKIRIILFLLTLTIYFLRYWSFFNNEVWMDSYRTYQTILGY